MSKSENKARISIRKLDNDNIVLHDDKSEYSKEFQVKIQHFYLIIFTKNNRCYSKFMDGEKTIRKLSTKPKYLNLKFIIAICPKKYSIPQKLISLSKTNHPRIFVNVNAASLDVYKGVKISTELSVIKYKDSVKLEEDSEFSYKSTFCTEGTETKKTCKNDFGICRRTFWRKYFVKTRIGCLVF